MKEALDPPIDCTFCSKFGSRAVAGEWYDAEIISGEIAVSIVGLGGPSEGYCLTLPRLHYSSFLSAPLQTQRAVMRDLRRLEHHNKATYGMSSVSFEHGTGPSNGRERRGPCIEHAHLHTLPLEQELVSALDWYPWTVLSDADLYALDYDREYLLIRQYGVWYWSPEPAPPPASQLIRRAVFGLLGDIDGWDWAAFPRFESSRLTIEGWAS